MFDVTKVKKTECKRARLHKRLNKKQREQIRLDDKRNSPGVPPNTCPYIDMTKTMISDLFDSYVALYERGEQQPKVEEISALAHETLEYIRRVNETLRDNSHYWYTQYKQLLNKK